MSYIKTLNNKLNKLYDGHVTAQVEGGCLVLSGDLRRWRDIVSAGKLAIAKNPYEGFVNKINCTGEVPLPVRKPRIKDDALGGESPDVLIIGGGIIGCSIARELSRYKLGVILVEKEHDLAMQTSGRGSGIVHSGIELKKGTLKHKHNRLGSAMFKDICAELGVEYAKTGKYLCFAHRIWQPFMFLSAIIWRWRGHKNVRVAYRDELESDAPGLGSGISSALHFPDVATVNPVSLTIAYAENAAQNGVSIVLGTMVRGMTVEDGKVTAVKTNRGTLHPKVIINAAGVFCEDIAKLADDHFYSIHPRKGTLLVADRKYANILTSSVVTSIPTRSVRKTLSKGGSVTPTVSGNVLIGPDAIETIHKEDFTTTANSLSAIMKRHRRTIPELSSDMIINYFSGVRAATYEEDFIIERGRQTTNIFHAAGIQSPGFTAAPSIALEVAANIREMFGGPKVILVREDFNPIRESHTCVSKLSDEERSHIISENPDFGVIVCKCEQVTCGEIVDSLRRNVRCTSIDGVKKRTGAGSGRCQGSDCMPDIVSIIAKERQMKLENVKGTGSGSDITLGDTKALLLKRASEVRILREGGTPEDTQRLKMQAKKMLIASITDN